MHLYIKNYPCGYCGDTSWQEMMRNPPRVRKTQPTFIGTPSYTELAHRERKRTCVRACVRGRVSLYMCVLCVCVCFLVICYPNELAHIPSQHPPSPIFLEDVSTPTPTSPSPIRVTLPLSCLPLSWQVETRRDFAQWMCEMHNEVNDR